jgi:hypothetical protein
MPDSFGTPQDKAATTASRLGSRYDANTAWSSLDATPSWQLGSDRVAQYTQHLPRRGAGQVAISLNFNDIDTNRLSEAPSRINVKSGAGPVELMRIANNFSGGITNTVLNPIQNLAGKFMA